MLDQVNALWCSVADGCFPILAPLPGPDFHRLERASVPSARAIQTWIRNSDCSAALTLPRRSYDGLISSHLQPNIEKPERVHGHEHGRARIGQIRKQAAEQGLDPNVWLHNVEVLAPLETRTYVSNIFKYYIAYKLVNEEEEDRRKAREAIGGKS